MQAQSTFEVSGWDQEDYEKTDGATFARARVTKTFTGEIEGTSWAELLLVGTADGPAAYTAQESFTGTVAGRSGTFASQHGAVSLEEGVVWTIVSGSGTGELAGLRGTGKLEIDDEGTHHFTLDYEID
jgi:hypothetical protein